MSQHTSALPRLDVFGDALPVRALSRCGTHRLWHPPQQAGVLYELNAVAFSPDSRQVVSAGGSTARVWSLEDGRELAVLSGHVGEVEAVRYVSPTCIATGGMDRTVRLWDAASGTELHRWTLSDGVLRLALSPDGRTLLAGSRGFAVLDLETRALVRWVWPPEGSPGGTRALAFSPDGSRVLALERHNEPWRLGVYDVATWTMRWSATGELYDRFAWATFSADGRTVSCAHTGPKWESLVLTYDASTGALLKSADEWGTLPVLLPDGRTVRVVGNRLVFFRGGEEERTLEIPSAAYSGDWEPVVSPDGRWLSFASGPATVLVMDLHTGETLPGHAHRSWVMSVAFSEDGAYLLTRSLDGTERRWECASGRQVERRVLEREDIPTASEVEVSNARVETRARLTALTLSRDGRLLATGDEHGEVRVWSTDGALLGVAEGHRSLVKALAFSPDGALLASGSADTTALIWPRSMWETDGR